MADYRRVIFRLSKVHTADPFQTVSGPNMALTGTKNLPKRLTIKHSCWCRLNFDYAFYHAAYHSAVYKPIRGYLRF